MAQDVTYGTNHLAEQRRLHRYVIHNVNLEISSNSFHSQYAIASNALYLWAIMFAKCSILALYLRVFGINRTFRRVCWVLGAMIFFYCVACTPLFVLTCAPSPVRSLAQVENNQGVPFLGLNVAVGAINIATDTALLLLPIPLITKLQMSKGRKVAVLLVFGTGLVYA